ncbi:MAG: HAMP domain-containing sensor histidine kinase [Pseudonocardia sediminis]
MTAAVLGLFAVLLLLVGVLVDVALGAQLRRDLDTRLTDRVTQAEQLAQAGAAPPVLVSRLQGQDIRVRVVTADGDSYGDPGLGPLGPAAAAPATPPTPPLGPAAVPSGEGPSRPAPPGPLGTGDAPGPPTPPDATSSTVTRTLPDGSQLVLVADTTAISDVRTQLRAVLAVSALVALVLALVAVALTVRVAMRPLDRMTGLARRITAGDRGSRLRPDRPRTDLGAAAASFDDMLDALEDAESRARESAERTRRFLSDAAHELRTPLAGITAVAETIGSRATDDERRQRRAALLLRETRQAARLVSDMLDLARIDGGLALQRTGTDLAGLVATEADRTRVLAPALDVTVTGTQPLPAYVDPVRVTQILSNLLDNARRHTPADGTITVTLERAGDEARVTVRNTGTPIADADRERIFDRLVRLQDSRDRDSGGAGLGLSIARGLARAHGGDLICPPDGDGATFRLAVPLGAASG